MICITTKLLKDNSKEISAFLQIEGTNTFAQALAKDLRNRKCQDHPNSTSVIMIISSTQKNFKTKIQKRFYCNKFESLIKIIVKLERK